MIVNPIYRRLFRESGCSLLQTKRREFITLLGGGGVRWTKQTQDRAFESRPMRLGSFVLAN
jgi:hypothetical protein